LARFNEYAVSIVGAMNQNFIFLLNAVEVEKAPLDLKELNQDFMIKNHGDLVLVDLGFRAVYGRASYVSHDFLLNL